MVIVQTNPPIAQTVALLIYYCFDLQGTKVMELVAQWRQDYQDSWLPLAVLESLYQGRYKAISVEQILNFWHRRREPAYHFTPEFERLVCHNLPSYFLSLAHTLEPRLELEQKEEQYLENFCVPTGITQFIPIRDSSPFYLKLRSVAQKYLENQFPISP